MMTDLLTLIAFQTHLAFFLLEKREHKKKVLHNVDDALFHKIKANNEYRLLNSKNSGFKKSYLLTA